jgi:hypothetical protein
MLFTVGSSVEYLQRANSPPCVQLMFNVGDEAIRHLFSRGTAYRFSYSSLAVFLTVYFFFACYSSGTDPLLHSCARFMK